jgi:CheY-like chemotaxis protein
VAGLPLLLLIDDDRDTRVAAGQLLAICGFRVAVAAGGQDGIAKARALRPDVVITDLLMPTVSGLTVCERLRTDPDTRHIPIVVYTGFIDVSLLARLYTLGVSVFAIKPCVPVVVAHEAQALLAPRSGRPAPLRVVTGYGERHDELAQRIQAQIVKLAS